MEIFITQREQISHALENKIHPFIAVPSTGHYNYQFSRWYGEKVAKIFNFVVGARQRGYSVWYGMTSCRWKAIHLNQPLADELARPYNAIDR